MSRHELTDEQWEVLAPLVARPRKRTGRPPVDNRRVLNGVLNVLNTGCAWMDMPREYGAYATAWRRHAQWSADGTLERIWRTLLGMLDEQGKLDWSKGFIDGSFVAAKKGGTASGRPRSAKAAR